MTDDLIERIATIIDPHAFDLGSRAHPEWSEPRKAMAIEKALAVIILIDVERTKPKFTPVYED